MIDPVGNTSLSLYDGANRLIESRQHLRQDGDGNNGPQANQSFEAEGGASVRTLTVYDGNGRTIALIDDRGSTTAYRHDTLDRQTEMEFADGSKRLSVYNNASDLTSYTDENGSIFAYSYDAMGRKTGKGRAKCPRGGAGIAHTGDRKITAEPMAASLLCRRVRRPAASSPLRPLYSWPIP